MSTNSPRSRVRAKRTPAQVHGLSVSKLFSDGCPKDRMRNIRRHGSTTSELEWRVPKQLSLNLFRLRLSKHFGGYIVH